ncbi:unnamed protein product [Amoebophrya sp. A120]|nr:unnamed protein product [Amoebophrya sp. A120]|eukprot:GSA120T00009393001.1
MLKVFPRVFLAFLFAAGAVGVSLAISSRVLVTGVQDEDGERNAKLESTASSTTSVATSEDEAPPDLRDVRLQRMDAAFSKIKDRLPEADRVVLQCIVSGRGNPRPLFGVRVLEFLASQQATPEEVEENWLKPDEELLWRAVLPLDEETVELITTQERFAGNAEKQQSPFFGPGDCFSEGPWGVLAGRFLGSRADCKWAESGEEQLMPRNDVETRRHQRILRDAEDEAARRGLAGRARDREINRLVRRQERRRYERWREVLADNKALWNRTITDAVAARGQHNRNQGENESRRDHLHDQPRVQPEENEDPIALHYLFIRSKTAKSSCSADKKAQPEAGTPAQKKQRISK